MWLCGPQLTHFSLSAAVCWDKEDLPDNLVLTTAGERTPTTTLQRIGLIKTSWTSNREQLPLIKSILLLDWDKESESRQLFDWTWLLLSGFYRIMQKKKKTLIISTGMELKNVTLEWDNLIFLLCKLTHAWNNVPLLRSLIWKTVPCFKIIGYVYKMSLNDIN